MLLFFPFKLVFFYILSFMLKMILLFLPSLYPILCKVFVQDEQNNIYVCDTYKNCFSKEIEGIFLSVTKI